MGEQQTNNTQAVTAVDFTEVIEGQNIDVTWIFIEGVTPPEEVPQTLPWGILSEVDNAWLRYWHFYRSQQMSFIRGIFGDDIQLKWKRGASEFHPDGFITKPIIHEGKTMQSVKITVGEMKTPRRRKNTTDNNTTENTTDNNNTTENTTDNS